MKISSVVKLLLKVLVFGVGIGLFLYWIDRLGVSALEQTLNEMKAIWWQLLLVSIGWNLFYTIAWRNYFINLNITIPFWALLKIKLCGEAMNLLTPLNFVVGDPVRFAMIRQKMNGKHPGGSILVDRMLNSLATVFYVWVGIILAFFSSFEIPRKILWPVFGLYTVINGGIIFLMVLIFKHEALAFILKIKRWLPGEKLKNGLTTAVDEMTLEFDFLKSRFWRFIIPSFLCHFAGRVLGAIEISVILYHLELESALMYGLVLASLTAACNLLFAFLPGGLGVVETFYSLFFKWQGMSDLFGVPVQLVRRIRSFFWIVVGVLLLIIPSRKRAT